MIIVDNLQAGGILTGDSQSEYTGRKRNHN